MSLYFNKLLKKAGINLELFDRCKKLYEFHKFKNGCGAGWIGGPIVLDDKNPLLEHHVPNPIISPDGNGFIYKTMMDKRFVDSFLSIDTFQELLNHEPVNINIWKCTPETRNHLIKSSRLMSDEECAGNIDDNTRIGCGMEGECKNAQAGFFMYIYFSDHMKWCPHCCKVFCPEYCWSSHDSSTCQADILRFDKRLLYNQKEDCLVYGEYAQGVNDEQRVSKMHIVRFTGFKLVEGVLYRDPFIVVVVKGKPVAELPYNPRGGKPYQRPEYEESLYYARMRQAYDTWYLTGKNTFKTTHGILAAYQFAIRMHQIKKERKKEWWSSSFELIMMWCALTECIPMAWPSKDTMFEYPEDISPEEKEMCLTFEKTINFYSLDPRKVTIDKKAINTMPF